MKILLLVFLMTITSAVYASNSWNDKTEVESSRLVCYYISNNWDHHVATSCVSKVSIEKDTLEKEVLQLQKEKLQLELSDMKTKSKKKK